MIEEIKERIEGLKSDVELAKEELSGREDLLKKVMIELYKAETGLELNDEVLFNGKIKARIKDFTVTNGNVKPVIYKYKKDGTMYTAPFVVQQNQKIEKI